jgi:hypothetical protein
MKTIDRIYHCQVPSQAFGVWQLQCRLRIFQPYTKVQAVMIAEMGFEIGWFNPFLIEKLVDQVVQEFDLDPAKLVWIEQYSSDDRVFNGADFNQVMFEWQNGRATNPQWSAIAPNAVQALIGKNSQPLPV